MTASPLLTILLILLAVGSLALLAYLLIVRFPKMQQEIGERMQSAQVETLKQAAEQTDRMVQQLQGMQNALAERLETQRKVLDEQLGKSGETVAGLQKQLGSLQEATKQITELGKDIASLEDILSSPKLRGGVGEIFLEKLLADIFPREFFDIQHRFPDGTVVDAVIRIGDRMVPIDSKFPVEDFRRMLEAEEADRPRLRRDFLRNVKKKIEDIASKYIQPDQGTYDFALMYIPAENVYYETVLREDGPGEASAELLDFAVQHRVIPVSPNSFYAYLQVILFGLKGMELEKKGDEILSHLRSLQGDLDRFGRDYGKLGTHLKNARGSYEEGEKRLDQLSGRIMSLESGAESLALPEPGTADED